jgi:hypothetical protein
MPARAQAFAGFFVGGKDVERKWDGKISAIRDQRSGGGFLGDD